MKDYEVRATSPTQTECFTEHNVIHHEAQNPVTCTVSCGFSRNGTKAYPCEVCGDMTVTVHHASCGYGCFSSWPNICSSGCARRYAEAHTHTRYEIPAYDEECYTCTCGHTDGEILSITMELE